MVTDQQVRRLRKMLMKGKTQKAAAAAAGMSERAARTWQKGQMPSEKDDARWWRTRKDPFAEVWDEIVVPLLERDPKGELESKTILEVLREQRRDEFNDGHLRTLQRRVRDWRYPSRGSRVERDPISS